MENKVSIIVPVFNRFEVADRAILSVLNQTYTDWQLIVIDDFSEYVYELPLECKVFGENIKLYRNSQNLGPGLSRKKGLELSDCDLVSFLDSDDYYHSHFLEHMVKEILINFDVAGVYCTSYDLELKCVRKSSDISFNKIMPTLFDFHRPWATCSWLWRRQYIGEWKSLRTNQDSLFEITTSFNNNKIFHVKEILCFIDKGTKSNTIDLVGNKKNELNRNTVVNFALDNIDKWKDNRKEVTISVFRRLLFVSARILLMGQRKLVFYNIRKLSRIDGKGKLLTIILIIGLIASIFSKQLGYRIIERARKLIF